MALWDERNLQGFRMDGEKLAAQTYSFPFSIQVPLAPQFGGPGIPPSFHGFADNHDQFVLYYLKVEGDRVGLHFDHKLRVPVLVSPIPPGPVWRSPMFLEATSRGQFPPGPDFDPQGWTISEHEMHLKGTFRQTLAHIGVKFALPNAPIYLIGSTLPFILMLDLHDGKKDDKVIKKIELSFRQTLTVSVSHPSRRETHSTSVLSPTIRNVEVEGRSVGLDEMFFHTRDRTKRVMGDFNLGQYPLSPDFSAPNLTLTWHINLDFDVPGLGNDEKMNIPITLAPFPEGMTMTPQYAAAC
ncbi:hypothetical protein BT69DRAFT_1283888 [Atractiella rhizophila]|nr:hypothetical protein BT69DRAFT_1283888 [Atractiella rhizophila]